MGIGGRIYKELRKLARRGKAHSVVVGERNRRKWDLQETARARKCGGQTRARIGPKTTPLRSIQNAKIAKGGGGGGAYDYTFCAYARIGQSDGRHL